MTSLKERKLQICKIKSLQDNKLDYYYSDNEGHILAKLSSETSFSLSAGDKFMQSIFLPFGITVDDHAVGIRNGGFGSTGA